MISSGSANIPKSYLEILSDECNKSTTPPVAALFFEKTGEIRLVITDEQHTNESEGILLITDFFHYALTREDWMKEFIHNTIELKIDPFASIATVLSGSDGKRILN